MVNHILIISLIPIFMYTLPTKSHKASADEAIYGLVDLEQLTLERDQGIAAANLRLESAQFQLREIKSLFYPEFFSRYSYFPGGGNFSAEEVDTRNRLSIRVRQDIIKYFKVKPLRVKESEAEVSAAEAERKESERRTLYELRINYIEALQEKLMADFSLRLKEMYEKLFELQTKRYLSKEVLFPEVQGAERELVEARESYIYHRDNFESRRDLIARHLDIMPDTIQIKEFEPPWYPIIEQKLVDTALQNRAEIKIVEANVLKEEARASAAGFEDINSSVFVGYLLREERGDSGFKSSPEIGAALSFPLNYLSIKKNRSKRFKAMKNFWELEANRVFQGVKMDIRKAHEKYLLENNNMLIAEKGIELKTDELRIEIARLEHPLRTVEASQANVLGIQAEIAKLTLENKIAKYEKAKAYYELIYLAGLYRPKELVSYDNAGGVETYRKKYVRALWVWDIEKFLSSKESQTFFIFFCKTKGINRVFLSLGESLLRSVSQDSYFPQFI
ncbi:MAG: TolC family protein, partial [Thermodesulfobacteriota bacterium]